MTKLYNVYEDKQKKIGVRVWVRDKKANRGINVYLLNDDYILNILHVIIISVSLIIFNVFDWIRLSFISKILNSRKYFIY